MPDEFNEGLGKRKAIYLTFAQAVPLVYTIDKENCLYFKKGRCRACEKFCENNAICFDQEDEIIEIDVGAVILATGYETFDACLKPEYGYGRYPNVITSMQYERILSAGGPFKGHIQRLSDSKEPKKIAWIQCVGCMDEEHPYCSRVCCAVAVKNCLKLKELNPDINIYVLYRDMRTFAFKELYYRKARQQGVRFLRYFFRQKPEVTETDGRLEVGLNLRVSFFDGVLHGDVELTPDMLVAEEAIRPHPEIRDLARWMRRRLSPFAARIQRMRRARWHACSVARCPRGFR